MLFLLRPSFKVVREGRILQKVQAQSWIFENILDKFMSMRWLNGKYRLFTISLFDFSKYFFMRLFVIDKMQMIS